MELFKTLRILVILFVTIILSSNILSAQELMRYTCQADRVDITEFESTRTFDSKGVIQSAKKYHPLSIARFGILAYYQYLETLDSAYYYKCINQIHYFTDSTRVNLILDGKGIGLPYNFKFWDLKAPWYSGMTQGFAISYLLRYYKLTKDESVLPVIKKIAFVLLAPQKIGGTISKTKEGCTWIEEYPNSKKSPQVLNGYINGLIGLYEYCNFFTDDIQAKKIFSETYECLKKSLEYYDTPTWSMYNRNKKSLSNKYLRYQIFEMKHLYELFQEPLFDAQMRIWSVMSYNKFIKGKSMEDKFKNYNFSKPVKKMNDSLYHIPLNKKQLVKIDSLEIYNFKSIREYRRHLKGKNKKITEKQSKFSLISFSQAEETNVNFTDITFNDSTLFKYEISAYKKSIKNPRRLVKVDIEKFYDNDRLFISFPKMHISDLLIKVEKKDRTNLSVTKLKFYDTSFDRAPLFAHYVHKPLEMEEGTAYKISLPLMNTDKAILFYKFAISNKKIKRAKWKAINTLDLNEIFIPQKSGLYTFMIVYNWNNPLSFIGDLNFTGLKDMSNKTLN